MFMLMHTHLQKYETTYSKTCYSTNFFSTKLDFTLFLIGSRITFTALFFEILLTFYSTIFSWFMIERKMSNFFFVVFLSSSSIDISVVQIKIP